MNDSKFLLNVSYRPPGSLSQPILDYLSNSISRLSLIYPGYAVIVGGDLNRLDISDLLIGSDLCQHNAEVTRNDALLDVVLTDSPYLVQSTSTIKMSFTTDHLGVIVNPLVKPAPQRRKCVVRDLSSVSLPSAVFDFN